MFSYSWCVMTPLCGTETEHSYPDWHSQFQLSFNVTDNSHKLIVLTELTAVIILPQRTPTSWRCWFVLKPGCFGLSPIEVPYPCRKGTN